MAFIGNQPFGKTVRSTSTETLTSVKTAFYPAGGYTVGYVDVFLNGSKLTEVSDFTATNGSLVTLLFNPEIGDTVEIVTYGSVEIANAVRRSGDTISGSLGASSFTVGSDFIANSTAITTTGSVGIGTSSPSKKLDVFNSGTTTTDFVVRNGTVSLLSFVDSGAGYTGTSTNHPLLFTTNNTERMRIDSSGNMGIGTSSPNQYVTNGRVFTVASSNANADPSVILQIGDKNYPGYGYYGKQVFRINSISSITEIARLTGTGANGIGIYFKVIASGHSASSGSGLNIKEYFFTGGTAAVTQISSTTSASNVPVITITNTTSNIIIVSLTSFNPAVGAFSGVCSIEWYVAQDFAGNSWTLAN